MRLPALAGDRIFLLPKVSPGWVRTSFQRTFEHQVLFAKLSKRLRGNAKDKAFIRWRQHQLCIQRSQLGYIQVL